MNNELSLVTPESSAIYRESILPAVEILQTASGLATVAAKTCVYYAVGTYGLVQLYQYPILVFQGATGTGKSVAMKALEQLVNNPKWLGSNLTRASLRDALGKAKDATAFIEEGDSIAEDIIANRYSRNTSKTSVKRTTGVGWYDSGVDYFGATVLHKRKSFNDPATVSRSIIIKTRSNPGIYHIPEVENDVRLALKQLWEQSYPKMEEMEYFGRAADVWRSLITVATVCGDNDWLRYATEEMNKATDKLKLGQEFEPEVVLVNTLISLSDKDRVSLTEVRENLRRENNWQPSAWAVADMIRDLGFEVKTSHGVRKVKIDKILLAEISKQLGIEGVSVDLPEISVRHLV